MYESLAAVFKIDTQKGKKNMKQCYFKEGPVEFDRHLFVEKYQYSYYLEGDGEKQNHSIIPQVSVNSNVAEIEIKRILSSEDWKKEDVSTFLAWKIGGINHQESKKEGKIIFYDAWEKGIEKDGETIIRARYFNCEKETFERFCKRLSEKKNYIKLLYKNGEAEQSLNEIVTVINGDCKEDAIYGLGPVYILTILYFITQEASPIFDRFAYTSVKAIYNGVEPNKIWYENPSSKSTKAIMTVINEYKWYLKQVFGTETVPRDVDRALWVYGHPDAITWISKHD